MSIRVFISHSTVPKEGVSEDICAKPAHAKFLESLCACLRNEKNPAIELIVDKYIPCGRYWREFLFKEMAECHAAIVLLNEQALDCSDWVETEVTVFGYRAFNEKKYFRLILVPFGGMTEKNIEGKKAWRPISINELQVVPRGGLKELTPDAVEMLSQQIIASLRDLPNCSGDAPSGFLVTRLCGLLPKEEYVLRGIASKLGISYSGSVFSNKLRIAQSLYARGPMALLDLEDCADLPHDWNASSHVRDILSTYWVDMKASIEILCCFQPDRDHHVFAINGKQAGYTPQTYVRQVCGQNDSWPVIEVSLSHAERHQEDEQESVIGQICNKFARMPRLKSALNPFLEGRRWTDLAIQEKISALKEVMNARRNKPVFVTFTQDGGGNVDDVINLIRLTFPLINIIICTGTKPNASPVLSPGVQMLMPELDLDKERIEFNDFINVT
jgi:hypothetical protein